jgi:uncharacterized alkaline shock family protein YloU
MVSRHRKDQPNLNLQGSMSLNGVNPPKTDEAERADGKAHGQEIGHPEAAGRIEVSPKAIAHLASRAAQRTYGVVGLASKSARPGWAELLRREEISKGVDVSFSDGQVVVNLYLILEYGTRISEVARNIMSNVKFALESSLGVQVVQVNVTVQGIRVSK